ncbi:MAG TPA: type II secretion system F family protein [Terriglobales bacterium]|nr:type II secretion system F family protein [Terriglobales bacterium]
MSAAAASRYRWQGLSPRGASGGGVVRADSPEAALAALQRHGWIVLRLEAASSIALRLPARRRLRGAQELAVVAQQLAAMVNAGLPLLQSLRLLARQQRDAELASTLSAVAQRVEGGATLTDALRHHPEVFGTLFVAMVGAGEASGRLELGLEQLAHGLERTSRVRRQVTKALLYPATILVIGLGAAALLLIFVVPAFAETFASFGAELPLPTRLVIAASRWLTAAIVPVIATIVAAALWLTHRCSTAEGRESLDRAILRLPLIGTLVRLGASARFAATLSTLIESGAPVLSALEVSARVAGNLVIERAVLSARDAVQQGQSLGAALQATELPVLLHELVAVAEQTGCLDRTLARAAGYFETELDQSIESFTAALEPAAVVFLGVTLGAVVIAMYLPVFRLGTLLG